MRVFRKDSNCVTRQIGAETIIVPIRANAADLTAVYTLNETASLVWNHIDGKKSVSQIADALSAEYDVAHTEAEQDVVNLLRSLESARLIQLIDCENEGPT